MTPIEKFYPWVTEDCPGVPEPTLNRAVIGACIDFTKDSLCIQRDLDKITSIPGTSDYEVAAPEGYTLNQITAAWYNGSRLDPIHVDALDADYEDWSSRTSETPKNLVMIQDGIVTLYPKPASRVSGGLKIRASLCVSRDATEVEDFLYEDYVEAIAANAKARLCIMPKKAWTNPTMYAGYMTQYKVGKNAALLLANKGRTRAELRVQIPRI